MHVCAYVQVRVPVWCECMRACVCLRMCKCSHECTWIEWVTLDGGGAVSYHRTHGPGGRGGAPTGGQESGGSHLHSRLLNQRDAPVTEPQQRDPGTRSGQLGTRRDLPAGPPWGAQGGGRPTGVLAPPSPPSCGHGQLQLGGCRPHRVLAGQQPGGGHAGGERPRLTRWAAHTQPTIPHQEGPSPTHPPPTATRALGSSGLDTVDPFTASVAGPTPRSAP